MVADVFGPAFYDAHWARAPGKIDAHAAEKLRRMIALVPADARSILDVGCGGGDLAHRLAERFDVTAVDRSPVALSRVRCPSILASAEDLPIPDRAADVVVASEVLEHVADPSLAAREIARVARTHVLVSVPHREDLGRRVVRCPSCRMAFHVDGHLHSIDARRLDALFPGFTRVATEETGPPEPVTFSALEETRRRLARGDWTWAGAERVCPRCGERRFEPPRRRSIHRWIGRGIDRITALVARAIGRESKPYWLIALYRRDA